MNICNRGFSGLWRKICRFFSFASRVHLALPKFAKARAALVAISLTLAACSGGGGGGGGEGDGVDAGSGSSASNFVVSGSVLAPGGAVAFLPRRNLLEQFADALLPSAYASISGFLPVADGTTVQLVRINNAGVVVSILASGTTSGGRYSFDLTSLGIGTASDLVVQVLDFSGIPGMRAFVASAKADVDPVSETAVRIVLEHAATSSLSNFTTQELVDIYSAVYMFVMVQALPNGANIESTVSGFRSASLADANIAAFIAAAAGAGQTTQGPGDIGNYFPFEQGTRWEYQGTEQDGGSSTNYTYTVQVDGESNIGGAVATIFRNSSSTVSLAIDYYLIKDSRGIMDYGSNDLSDFLTPQFVPYRQLNFPLVLDHPWEQLNEPGLNWPDEDGDGIPETVGVTSTVTVMAFETVVVPAGTYANAAKIITSGDISVRLSGDGTFVTVPFSLTQWNAPDVGLVKVVAVVGDLAYTEVLTGFTAPVPVTTVRQISLVTKDLIYDPSRKLIYASVPGSGGSLGNTITVIDPETGSIGPSVFMGSEPGKLAISDNGQYLYVGLDEAAAVRRLILASMTPDIQFSLGSDSFFGPYYPEDIEVLPGSPGSVAVSRKYLGVSPRHAGVGIYDNDVIRPTVTPGHTGSNVIEFSATASRLYGYNNETTEHGFRRMTVSSSGVSTDDSAGSLISGFSVDIKFDNSRVYSTSGRVIDPEARVLVGTYPLSFNGVAVRPDSGNNLVFFLGYDFFASRWKIETFDLTTFVSLGTLEIPGISYPSPVGSLVRWGHSGLAFRSSDKIFLFESPLIP